MIDRFDESGTGSTRLFLACALEITGGNRNNTIAAWKPYD